LITANNAPSFNHINRFGSVKCICPISLTRKPLAVGVIVGADVDVARSVGTDVKVGGATTGDAADVGATVCVGVAAFVAAASVWVGIGVPSTAVEASQAITVNIIIAKGKSFLICVSLSTCLRTATSHSAALFH
jgi:hypothetical protein